MKNSNDVKKLIKTAKITRGFIIGWLVMELALLVIACVFWAGILMLPRSDKEFLRANYSAYNEGCTNISAIVAIKTELVNIHEQYGAMSITSSEPFDTVYCSPYLGDNYYIERMEQIRTAMQPMLAKVASLELTAEEEYNVGTALYALESAVNSLIRELQLYSAILILLLVIVAMSVTSAINYMHKTSKQLKKLDELQEKLAKLEVEHTTLPEDDDCVEELEEIEEEDVVLIDEDTMSKLNS